MIVLSRRLLIFLVFFVFCSTSVIVIYSSVNDKYMQVTREVEHLREQVVFEFTSASENLRSIARSPSVRDYLVSRNSSDRASVSNLLISLAEDNPRYDQIRIIGKSGYELVRIDREDDKIITTDLNKLQNKSGRYYFMDTMKLSDGEMYVSPLDLNVEDGKIEFPYKPTIRIATPLFDVNGNKLGMAIINYLASEVLDEFDHHDSLRKDATIMFTNSDGYFFRGPHIRSEWGFMFKGREDEKFGKYFPQAWKEIIRNNSGYIFTSKGLFIYDKIYPINDVQLLQDAGDRTYSYFTKQLSVKDFSLVIVISSTWQQVFWVLLTQVMIKPVLVTLPLLFVFKYICKCVGPKK